jgi:putative polymerase
VIEASLLLPDIVRFSIMVRRMLHRSNDSRSPIADNEIVHNVQSQHSVRSWVASALVFLAATFNWGLCYVNTHYTTVTDSHVMVSEALIIGSAIALSYHAATERILFWLFFFMGYFAFLWLITGAPYPKIIRDLLIPIVFFTCGVTWAKPSDADRLVYALIVVTFIFALAEWLFLDAYMNTVDVLSYYVNKGGVTIEAASAQLQGTLAVNAQRPGEAGRMGSFLIEGNQRVSSIFLEPISAENFAAICFAWLVARFRIHTWVNILFIMICIFLILLADGRLAVAVSAIYLLIVCIPQLASFFSSKIVLAVMPAIVVVSLIAVAAAFPMHSLDEIDTFFGRFVGSGQRLASFDWTDWLGIANRPQGEMADSGYSYVLANVGILGTITLWAIYAGSNVGSRTGSTYRAFITILTLLSLCVSGQGLFSIKTAALMWYLAGAAEMETATVDEERVRSGLSRSLAM